ncbi:MAG: diaminopimelate epimerase [Lachnospiraceae bacterium]|nr:diaminopimelate epimerase [Lachnospiraceae bacterium]
MKFTKMHGCGNDYIYVDGSKEKVREKDKPELVRRLSDRHFGIGGDGVIFINPSEEADFEMEMYNMDGTRAEMCGNGIRCVAKFVYDKGLTDKTSISIVSCGKVKHLELSVEDGKVSAIKVNMGQPILKAEEIPVTIENNDGFMIKDDGAVISAPIEVGGQNYKMTCVSMGNPHAVVFVDDVSSLELEKIGPLFENHACFPRRINTEFVKVLDRENIEMRVWERGTGETLACGTGACASVVASVLNGLTQEQVTVKLLGGNLQIRWDREEDLVYMTGPAATVFEGEIE